MRREAVMKTKKGIPPRDMNVCPNHLTYASKTDTLLVTDQQLLLLDLSFYS